MENSKFHNIHRGQRCFILGTGPSINKQDLKPLKNEICIAVSSFYLHKDIGEINPRYHVDAPIHAPFDMDFTKKCFETYRKYYPKMPTFFFGHTSYEYSYFNFLEQNPEFMSENFHFLNYMGSPTLDEWNYNKSDIWDIMNPLFDVRSTVYCAIQVAVYMGFKEIYLLGCDLDYISDISLATNPHFYSADLDINHVLEMMSTEEVFLTYYLKWKQFRLMKEYLLCKNCKIFNATEGGMLDVFPLVRLNDIVSDQN